VITEWIPKDTQFSATIRVEGITRLELGTLLWLLRPTGGQVHLLGMGKPLGFGAVSVQAKEREIRIIEQDALVSRYQEIADRPAPVTELKQIKDFQSEYECALESKRATALRDVQTAFIRSRSGFLRYSVHYPGLRRPGEGGRELNATGEPRLFDWWTRNEGPQQRRALPHILDDDPTLPYYD
jgi:hypothetical protein